MVRIQVATGFLVEFTLCSGELMTFHLTQMGVTAGWEASKCGNSMEIVAKCCLDMYAKATLCLKTIVKQDHYYGGLVFWMFGLRPCCLLNGSTIQIDRAALHGIFSTSEGEQVKGS
ncbi:hypothetical protein GOP47_0016451 [Adiantum capillus-veneris]|uniref:Uncharacterized protein n=1 Tax=Adiantum capillus-veneris TaxID=13818 RepID=A0A9D4UHP3_ADICA|nr:hypothetical protein GOP47_0016451 [Adiantum capillus-veneris]